MDWTSIRSFKAERLSEAQRQEVSRLAARARRDVLRMIHSAGSGHVGGSLSSLDAYLLLLLCAETASSGGRDRVVVSHGHTAAGLYAAMGGIGLLDVEEAVRTFRRDGSIYEGHPSLQIPGIEWASGSLGQGLSVGCGMALAEVIKGGPGRVFVVMGDGEQAGGQLQEAREFAVKYRLGRLIGIVDCNGLQASGRLEDVMPQNIAAKYAAAGWGVIETDGHDHQALYQALRTAVGAGSPTVILARTVMGKGVPAIEGQHGYHGKVPAVETWAGLFPPSAGDVSQVRPGEVNCLPPVELSVRPGTPRVYTTPMDCRSACGEAIYDLSAANADVPIAVIDCDLIDSMRLGRLAAAMPERLIECGIQEHNAATVAAAMSRSGVLTFYADFGVFGVDEVYGQLRMADFNETSLKLICTHVGLDAGEDGKTHQCVDYVSLLANLHGFKTMIAADANQADRMIRYAARTAGNVAVCMGRSKLPVLTDEDGGVFYGGGAAIEYGRADWIRRGGDAAIVTCGSMVWRAVNVSRKLAEAGIRVGVLNLSCPVALDDDALAEACRTGLVVTYEDHNAHTGIGAGIGARIAERGSSCRFKRIGINAYGKSANPEFLYRQQAMDEDSLHRAVLDGLNHRRGHPS